MNANPDSIDKEKKESSAMNTAILSDEAFAHLGGGEIAYVKSIRSDDVTRLFPQAPQLEPGMELFALHAADGTPIMVTDSRESAVASARTHELETVSVH